YPVGLPAASAFTAAVVNGWPPIPQSPLLTSSMMTDVTWRMVSPSIDTMTSVSFRIISCFCAGVNTPSINLTFTRGMGALLSMVRSCPSDAARAGRPLRFRRDKAVEVLQEVPLGQVGALRHLIVPMPPGKHRQADVPPGPGDRRAEDHPVARDVGR